MSTHLADGKVQMQADKETLANSPAEVEATFKDRCVATPTTMKSTSLVTIVAP